MNALATDEDRGRIVSGFMITMAVGFGIGPLVTSAIGVDTWTPFYLSAGVVGLSLVPLILAKDVAPDLPKSEGWSFGIAMRVAPGLMIIALFAGITDATLVSFFPVYAVREGFGSDMALYMLTAIILGSVLIQFPLGVLADKLGRNGLLAIFLLLTILFGGLIPFTLQDVMIWPLLIAWGGVAFGLYTLCIILLGDRFDAATLAGANAALVSMYEIGGVTGPVVVGHAIDRLGPDGMPIVLVLSGIPVAIFFGLRRLKRK